MKRQNKTKKAFWARCVSRIILTLALFSLSGCSIFLAASSPDEPDLSILRKGASRASIEKEFGPPIKFDRRHSGDTATYTYLGADEVSYGRAATYAIADIVTLGLAELVTAPIETLQNGQNIVEVTYDYKGRLKSFKHIKKEAPLDQPERILGLEKDRQVGI